MAAPACHVGSCMVPIHWTGPARCYITSRIRVKLAHSFEADCVITAPRPRGAKNEIARSTLAIGAHLGRAVHCHWPREDDLRAPVPFHLVRGHVLYTYIGRKRSATTRNGASGPRS